MDLEKGNVWKKFEENVYRERKWWRKVKVECINEKGTGEGRHEGEWIKSKEMWWRKLDENV